MSSRWAGRQTVIYLMTIISQVQGLAAGFSNKGGSVLLFFFAGPLVMWHVIIGVPDSTLAMFREPRVVGVVVKRWITGNICRSK